MIKVTYTDDDGRTYELGRGIGAWAISNERLPIGTTRVIKGKLLCVYRRTTEWFSPTCYWTPLPSDPEEYNHDALARWKVTP